MLCLSWGANFPGTMMSSTEAFEVFVRDYQNMVFATALRLLGNETDAADISQEVFLRAYERFAEVGGDERRGGWLKTVTTNLCLNHLSRYRSRWRFFSDMLPGAEPEEDYAANLPAPEPEVGGGAEDTARQQAILEAALQRLPANQRVPLVLYHFEDLTYEEIAARLGVSLGKVKTDIHRGRTALRQRLQRTAEGELAAAFQPPPPVPPRRALLGCV